MTRTDRQQLADGRTAVRQASLREHNLGLLLRRVAAATHPAADQRPGAVAGPSRDAGVPPAAPSTDHGTSPTGRPPSRADLAAATGLTRATVSTLVDDLLSAGLLAEVGPAPRTGAGRPAAGLVLAADGLAGLGLEINVDYLAACVVDLRGRVRHRAVHRADLRPVAAPEALDRIADLAAAARAAAHRQRLRLAGAALAVPGLVTPDGLVRLAPNLGWREVDVPAVLGGDRRILGDPAAAGASGSAPGPVLRVGNEANLAAIGEAQLAGPATANFLYVSGEIGIGAGIVLDGSLFRGARGWSGELGHVPVHPDGPVCRCGARGCLEQYAGQEAIVAAAGLDAAGLDAAALDSANRPGRSGGAVGRLVELAGTGEPVVCRALAEAGAALGVAIAGVINMLDLDHVVLGGIYAPLAPWLVPSVTAEIDRRVLTAAWSPVTVRPAVLGGEAAVYGAAGSVVQAVLDRPAHWMTPTARAAAGRS